MRLIFKLFLALPIAGVFLLAPFFVASWVRSNLELEIPMVIVLAVSLGGCFLSFFAIVGKQMKIADEEWRSRKSHAGRISDPPH